MLASGTGTVPFCDSQKAYGVLPGLAVASDTYTIKEDDSFWVVAQQRGTTVAAIQAVHPGVVAEWLQIAQKTNLPCTGDANPCRCAESSVSGGAPWSEGCCNSRQLVADPEIVSA